LLTVWCGYEIFYHDVGRALWVKFLYLSTKNNRKC